ncbi:MAG: electron transfer flavoprotein subunit alpha/FixB family protein [Pseudomonadota bacterium]|nr:electron transfer flavoprotein subunit alpha/FixB family protein [Pseudomonadota bacterium]
MGGSTGPVWVFAEQNKGTILPVSLELIGRARGLADDLGTTLEVIVLGKDVQDQAPILFNAGADTIFLGDHAELEYYQADFYTQSIVELATKRKPEIFLLGTTPAGKELAPLVAARLQTGLTAHCIDLKLDEEKRLEQIIPAYGGLISIVCPEKRPQMATIAKGVFPKPDISVEKQGQLVHLDIAAMENRSVELLQVVREEEEGVTLEDAATIVAGGAGARDPDGWQQIASLADELGGALGATRPPVDEGWIELDKMIGQSGKMVSPDLYIGVGLSGELQHMVGITGAKVMVAINNEPKAPVFEQVDYGIVDDCREFLPVFIDKIRKYKADNGIS